MKLYLVRHGDADATGSLTPEGREGVERVAALLKGAGLEVDEIIHSVKERARQTAEILGRGAAPDVVLVEREGMKPMDEIAPIVQEIESYERNVMLVGHLPFMERVLGTLLYGEERLSPVLFSGGCVVCLDNSEGRWVISWVASPEIA